jgi:hypothetical protein
MAVCARVGLAGLAVEACFDGQLALELILIGLARIAIQGLDKLAQRVKRLGQALDDVITSCRALRFIYTAEGNTFARTEAEREFATVVAKLLD